MTDQLARHLLQDNGDLKNDVIDIYDHNQYREPIIQIVTKNEVQDRENKKSNQFKSILLLDTT